MCWLSFTLVRVFLNTRCCGYNTLSKFIGVRIESKTEVNSQTIKLKHVVFVSKP